MSQIPQRH